MQPWKTGKALLITPVFPILCSILNFTKCYEGVKMSEQLGSGNYFYFAIRAVVIWVTKIRLFGKEPLDIAAMNAELPPFENLEQLRRCVHH